MSDVTLTPELQERIAVEILDWRKGTRHGFWWLGSSVYCYGPNFSARGATLGEALLEAVLEVSKSTDQDSITNSPRTRNATDDGSKVSS
jgi:hypothetical protein